MPLDAADPSSWLTLHRTVRFGDTDAAGVMHFHQLLRWCHEAYEESLERFGIPAAEVFPSPTAILEVALPIVHSSAEYLQPLVCGDRLIILLQPQRLRADSFEVWYEFSSDNPRKVVARAITRHRAINSATRKACELPHTICRWLEGASQIV
jgi:1,4-dihydroxy-2-naphthoyl-CoA hydrolase